MKVNTNKIKLAEVKFFDKEHSGVEFGSPLSYVMLYEVDDEYTSVFNGKKYINLFGPDDIDLVFERSRFYSCYNSDGVDYGTKLNFVTGQLKTGPCCVLTGLDFSEVFNSDSVDYESLQSYVLKSDKYFMDRVNIAKERLIAFRNPVRMLRIIDRDKVEAEKMNKYFAERGIQKVKKG